MLREGAASSRRAKLQQNSPLGRLRRRLLRNGGGVAADDRALIAREFDRAWYLEVYPDVARHGGDPLDHFLRHGWKEGRDPSRSFSVHDYLDAYPDVAASGMNPFVHYLRAGRAEGRRPTSALGFRYQVLSRLKPISARMARAAAANAEVEAMGPAELLAGMDVSRGGGLHVSFSHDDYMANVGGVQLCLQREAAGMEAMGRDHLHLFPARPWPMVLAGEGSLLGVLWNGTYVGDFSPAVVVEAVANLAPGERSLAIHSMLGHEPEEVLAIAGAAGVGEGFFWLHDFASLCAGYHLTRNDVADCGAPAPDSGACNVCLYGPYRMRHVAAHRRLFEALSLTVAAPAESTLATWRQGIERLGAQGEGFEAAREVVLPHAALVNPRPAGERAAAGPLRIGFLGWAAPLKGWPVFRELAIRYADDPRYAFHHIASSTPPGLPIEFERASPTPERPSAVRDAVEAVELDVALIWPLCRETFSFTAYEAYAGGAAVLTSPDSGNVAAFVAAQGAGQVLADEAALYDLFETGDILALSRDARAPVLYDLDYGAMTAALIKDDRR